MLPRSVITFFCDDVREEKSGMDTLIGIYPDNINAPSFPFSFPKLAIYTRLNIDIEDSLGDIKISVSIPGSKTTILSTLSAEYASKSQADASQNNSPMVGLISKAIAISLSISEPGQLRTTVTIGEEKYVGGVLNIRQVPSPADPTDEPS